MFRGRFIQFSSIFLVVFLGVVSGCSTVPGLTVDDNAFLARKKFQQSLEFASLKLWDKQIASLREAIELAPKELNYRAHLGGAYMAKGRLDKAEKEFLKILEMDKNYQTAYRHLGQLNMIRKNWKPAVYFFKEDLSRPGTPMPHQVYNWLAWSYYNLGEINKAEQEWKNALRISENPEIRLNLALSYKNREVYDKAMESLEKAVLLDPKFPLAHYEMALLYLRENNKKNAVDHFEKVLRLAPKSEQAQSSREFLTLIQSGK